MGIDRVLQATLSFMTTNLGWLFLIIVLGFVLVCVYLAFSRYGNIKLGQPEDKPEYSTLSWFAMLFSAGMGIGLVFWSIAEPLSHFSNPPLGEAFSQETIVVAMRYTFFHWGFHPWAIYGIVGLSLAYFTYRKQQPMLISSAFTPILGKGAHGPVGKVLDALAVFATVFGVATSLGLGTMQISSGLNHLFGLPTTTIVHVGIIIIITFLFVLSAVAGISKGIKLLSNVNMALATLLLLFIFVLGPTGFILTIIPRTVGQYLQHFLTMSLNTDPAVQAGWVGSWTVFYWAWWIAWAPFVGGFIARISKGRTIRQFVLGVLIAPVMLSFVWMGTFGGTALHLAGIQGVDIVSTVLGDISSGLFVVLQQYPLTGLLSALALIVITIFFITSADSATFVVGMLLSKGNLEPKNITKIIIGGVQGAIAILLLVTGGLTALQTASIIAAFPFMLLMVCMTYALLKELRSAENKIGE